MARPLTMPQPPEYVSTLVGIDEEGVEWRSVPGYEGLYIVSDDDYLYEIDLLNVDFKEEKINIKDYKNKITEYTIMQSDFANSVDINFENGESIKLK